MTPTLATILIVEDDPDSAYLCREYLAENGYHAVIAASGQTAAAEALALRPAVILLDLMMPLVDGFEVARQLRAEPVTAVIPIVIMSAISHVHEHATEMGSVGTLAKPFDLGLLDRAVACALRQPDN